MFSQKEFIAASRQFVCVRLESYESEEHQTMVRELLRGAFANTAFCILAPDGKTKLSGSGRGPSALFGRRGGPTVKVAATVEEMAKLVKKYRMKGNLQEAKLQDFHSVRQAVNVASGDQRLLLLTVGEKAANRTSILQAVLNDKEAVGRFHHDFVGKDEDPAWQEILKKKKKGEGFLIVRPDSFGLEGTVVSQLSPSATAADLKKALFKTNTVYAMEEKRKVYRDHVHEARRRGAYFENGMPYGEDRNGDGVIDPKPGRGRGRARE